jgi:hypothetical protein
MFLLFTLSLTTSRTSHTTIFSVDHVLELQNDSELEGLDEARLVQRSPGC